MIALYNGNEYHCIKETDISVLLGSKTKVDSSWIGYVDEQFPYRKTVLISDVDKIYSAHCFGVYNGQEVEVCQIKESKVRIIASTSYGFTREFIDVVFSGEEGRDISIWNEVSIFSGLEIRYYCKGDDWKVIKNASVEDIKNVMEKMFG